MIGFVEEWTAVGIVAGSLTAVITCGYAVVRAWRSIKRRLVEAWSAAVDHSETGHLVRYHLGPNSGTPPIHERIRRLEVVHGIKDTEETI